MAQPKKGRTEIFIYPDWCKGCGLCAAFCPKNVFMIDAQGKAQVVNEEACVNCGFCELHCPDFAIVLRPKDEESAPAEDSNKPKAAS
jgi:2-oxoglutarate ferredoxin oxidoreductase subunit delta